MGCTVASHSGSIIPIYIICSGVRFSPFTRSRSKYVDPAASNAFACGPSVGVLAVDVNVHSFHTHHPECVLHSPNWVSPRYHGRLYHAHLCWPWVVRLEAGHAHHFPLLLGHDEL